MDYVPISEKKTVTVAAQLREGKPSLQCSEEQSQTEKLVSILQSSLL